MQDRLLQLSAKARPIQTLFWVLIGTALACPAQAIEIPSDEDAKLKACEEKVCTIILKREKKGGDIDCRLSKTWASDTIKGGETKTVKWGFGDAQCITKVAMTRNDVLSALNNPKHTLSMPKQTVRCEVERQGELKRVSARASPRLDFKNGRADKFWINLEDVSGPTDIKGTIWAAAQLEDALGIFHKSMIKKINKFIYKRCDDKYGPKATAEKLKKLKKKKEKAARKKKQEEKKAAKSKDKAPADDAPEKKTAKQ